MLYSVGSRPAFLLSRLYLRVVRVLVALFLSTETSLHNGLGRFSAWFDLAGGFCGPTGVCVNSGTLKGRSLHIYTGWAPEASSKTESCRKPARTMYWYILRSRKTALTFGFVWSLGVCRPPGVEACLGHRNP